jgi:uncharacterized protein (TIGR00661 family)
LVYLIEEHSIDKFIGYANKHKEHHFIIFTEDKFVKKYPTNVERFGLNEKQFLSKLKCCDSVICNGGFQLICESVYLNKYVNVIPLHYEQLSNVYNLEKCGKGGLLDI